MPRATIHIPTYNQARFLPHALDGALNQTYDDYNVVVSNNHSTDETAAVLELYADNPRLTVVMPPAFLGVAEHFKFCVSQSDSELFSYLCSDDGVFPGFLAEQIALLDAHPSAGYVHSAAERIDEQGQLIRLEKSLRRSGLTPAREEFKRTIYGTGNIGDAVVFRRALFDQVGGFGALYVNDWELALKMCTVGDVVYNQNVLMQYRDWGDEARTPSKQLANLEGVCAFYETYHPQYPEFDATFRDARERQALANVVLLGLHSGARRERILQLLRRLSASPRVALAIWIFEHGLGGAYMTTHDLARRGKYWLKRALFPLLSPSSTGRR